MDSGKKVNSEEVRLRPGLSGIIRAKNEARFIGMCIDSVIDALDELVVVYNDCTDETPRILAEKRKQYPDKLKVYAYDHKILGFNLSKEEYEYAVTLPEDSPQLICSECNFALSMVTCSYAMKVDPDQIYFADEIRQWRDVCMRVDHKRLRPDMVLGVFFVFYVSVYRRLSAVCGHPLLWMIPDGLVRFCRRSYRAYAEYRLQCGTASVSLSGVNVFYDEEWFIPFDRYNIHPPYNGEGDHVIFKKSKDTFFEKRLCPSFERGYRVSEKFRNPYKMMFAGPVWFHLHANRAYCFDKVKKVKEEHPELFVRPTDFLRMTYKDVLQKMDPKVNTLFQRVLFALVHKMGADVVKRHLHLLEGIRL